MGMNTTKDYVKRERKRKLRRFSEYNMMAIAWVFSFAIFLLIRQVASGTENGFGGRSLMLGLIYLAAGALGGLIHLKMHRDIVSTGEISLLTRRLSWLLLPFLFSGNFFMAIAAFHTIKREKSLEYTLATYSIVIMVCVMLVSLLNLFKGSVVESFYPGLGLLGGLGVFYAIVAYMAGIYTFESGRYKIMLIPAVLCILTGLTGNMFAVALGLVVISRYRSLKKNRSVEWIDTVRRMFRNYMSVIGMFIIVFLITISVCSILTFDYSIAIDNSYLTIKQHPSLMFPFGTDDFGRCVFTRIIFGARISLVVGMIATVVPLFVGGLLGAVAGHFSSLFDNIIMRTLDILYAVPSILLAIAIVAAFGASTVNLIIALSIGMIPIYARTMRAQVMMVTSSEFVEAARACGQNELTILLRHIVPNALAPMIVRATMSIGSAVLSTSSMSFLGLGVEPHIPEWGNILKAGSNYLETHFYMALYPGLAIILIVLAFNFFGDGLRDALDPKLK